MTKNLLLVEISEDEEVVAYCHTTNAVAWGSELYTTEQYIEREKHLRNQVICTDPKIDKNLEQFRAYLGIKYYAFKDLSLPNTDKVSQIVSSVETINRVGYIREPNSEEEIPILSVCIGGVYTPEKFRGKGYASSMIKSLNKLYDDIATEHSDSFLRYTTMFLYSEVGEFYQKLEYQSRHIPIHYLENDSSLLKFVKDLAELKRVEPLAVEDVNENLVTCLNTELEECDKLASASDLASKYKFYIKPDLDIYKWFKARDVFISSVAFPELVETHPLIDGFKVADSKSHIIWHHNWNEDKLNVLKMHIENFSQQDAVTLLAKALEELVKYRTKKLIIWDEDLSSDSFNDLFKKLEKHDSFHAAQENSSLSAIRAKWSDNVNQIEWINNGKYAWF